MQNGPVLPGPSRKTTISEKRNTHAESNMGIPTMGILRLYIGNKPMSRATV